MKASMTYREPLKLYRADVSPYQARDYQQQERALLESQGHCWVEDIDSADILITNTHTKLDRFDLNVLQKLKLIVHPNSGYDNFSVEQMKQLNCPVIIGNSIRAQAVATHTLACLFHAIGMPPWKEQWDKSRSWPRPALQELKVQLIGHGHLGKILSVALKPLVQKIDVYDPYQDLHDLNLAQADFVILACGLNASSLHFLNRDKFAQLKSSATIINPARGKLIETEALIDWLKHSPNTRAYLDVFESEPFDFGKMPNNAFCSSHIAGVDQTLDQRIMSFVAQVINDYGQLTNVDFTHKWQNAILSKRIVDDHFI